MKKESIDKAIKDYLKIKFSYVDLFYAFCAVKGIEDPESDLTDEEYEALEKEFESKLEVADLSKLNSVIINLGSDQIYYTMETVAKR